jgi:hypothetical protein
VFEFTTNLHVPNVMYTEFSTLIHFLNESKDSPGCAHNIISRNKNV